MSRWCVKHAQALWVALVAAGAMLWETIRWTT